MEAAVDCYLPLIESFEELKRDGIGAPVTFSVTPIVAAQLAHRDFPRELRAFFAQRLAACDEAERDVSEEPQLAAVVRFWRNLYEKRSAYFDELHGDLISALRRLEDSGTIELMSAAATHGFLPLLARDESIRLQLLAGRGEHERLFGRSPRGCWLPECAYRPRGPWAPWPGGPSEPMRDGLETHVEAAGFRFVVVDAHLAEAGRPLEAYGRGPSRRAPAADPAVRSPYGDYVIGNDARAIRALVRDPASTRQVWSRDGGYPGGDAYLEFHKIRFPGGLKLWEVTGPGVSLGDKRPYSPDRARHMADGHAAHFSAMLDQVAAANSARGTVIVAPFDSELFGHWWFEGPEFIADTYRALRRHPGIRPVTASAHVREATAVTPLSLPEGSWGRDGDFSMWLNNDTAWTWTRLWELEERFWNVAPKALAQRSALPILTQAARELLLAQSSDWQFIISTGEVRDYGERRFALHADDTEALVAALEQGGDLSAAAERASELNARDSVFPGVLEAVAQALVPSAVPA